MNPIQRSRKKAVGIRVFPSRESTPSENFATRQKNLPQSLKCHSRIPISPPCQGKPATSITCRQKTDHVETPVTPQGLGLLSRNVPVLFFLFPRDPESDYCNWHPFFSPDFAYFHVSGTDFILFLPVCHLYPQWVEAQTCWMKSTFKKTVKISI